MTRLGQLASAAALLLLLTGCGSASEQSEESTDRDPVELVEPTPALSPSERPTRDWEELQKSYRDRGGNSTSGSVESPAAEPDHFDGAFQNDGVEDDDSTTQCGDDADLYFEMYTNGDLTAEEYDSMMQEIEDVCIGY